MVDQCLGDGVGHGTDGLLASRVVSEDREVRGKEVVRLRDRDLEAQPVTGRRDGIGRKVVVREPLVDGRDGLVRRCDERSSLRHSRLAESMTKGNAENSPPPS